MRVLVIDNCDSFTYDPVRYLGELKTEALFRRNEVSPEELLKLHPDRIVVSPGPCTPNEAGISPEAAEKVPELGVCHRAMGQVYGEGGVRGEPVHGKTAKVLRAGSALSRSGRGLLEDSLEL